MIKRTLNLSTPELLRNPYDLFSELRQNPCPAWMEENQDVNSDGKWVFSRYEDVKQILQISEGISKDITRLRDEKDVTVFDMNMLTQDPPNHTRLRRIANQAFSVEKITRLHEFIREVTFDLIDSIRKSGDEFDFIKSFAARLPILVITKLLGVPAKDQPMFRDWSIELSVCLDSANSDTEIISKKKRIFSKIQAYFIEIISQRRVEPKDDLISQLIHLHDVEEKLKSDEVLAMCMLLLFAGNDTTVNLIGNGLYTLLRNPDQFELLKNDPRLIKSAVEEMLRYESPLQRSSFRVCIDEIKIGNVVIPKGDQICGLIGAANRDTDVFENAERFDIGRSPNRHLAFGLGSHTCIGSLLARTEAAYAFNGIIEYIPNLELLNEEVEWNQNSFLRGIRSMPLKWH